MNITILSLQKLRSLTSYGFLTCKMNQIILVIKMHSSHTQAILPLPVLCSLPETSFSLPLSSRQNTAAQSVTSSRKPSLHPASSFPAELHAFHLCSNQTPSALDFDCWLTGLPSFFRTVVPKPFLIKKPINKKFKP